MTKRCLSCGQLNPDAALICEFCKAVFGKPAKKPPVPAAPKVELAQGWSSGALVLVAVFSGAAGFALRTVLPRTEPKAAAPAVVVAPPPPPKPVAGPQPPPPVVPERKVLFMPPARCPRRLPAHLRR